MEPRRVRSGALSAPAVAGFMLGPLVRSGPALATVHGEPAVLRVRIRTLRSSPLQFSHHAL